MAEHQDIASGKDDCRPGLQAALTLGRQSATRGGAGSGEGRSDHPARSHPSGLLEEGLSIRATDMPGADDLMMRVYAAMAQKERELISEQTRAALAPARARGAVLSGARGYRPAAGPDAAAAALARREVAEHGAHRLVLQVERLMAKGVLSQAALAGALHVCGAPTPTGLGAWTHTTDARVMVRANA